MDDDDFVEPEPEFVYPERLLPGYTFHLRLSYEQDFCKGFVVVDVTDPKGNRCNTLRYDLLTQQISAENPDCDEMQQMRERLTFLVFCYDLQHMYDTRGVSREEQVNQRVNRGVQKSKSVQKMFFGNLD